MSSRWAHEPHIRAGDPCYWCGVGMVPQSVLVGSTTTASGMRKHGGHGLCKRCYDSRRRDPQIADLVAQAREAS